MKQNPVAYQYDFDGECKPKPGAIGSSYSTFSVGVFQWLPKKRGGLKRSKVIKRIRGYTNNPQDVYDKAQKICNALNITTAARQ